VNVSLDLEVDGLTPRWNTISVVEYIVLGREEVLHKLIVAIRNPLNCAYKVSLVVDHNNGQDIVVCAVCEHLLLVRDEVL
jgi:hypothetical protein